MQQAAEKLPAHLPSKNQRFRKQAQRWLERIQADGTLASAKPKEARALAN
jgi:hypothetical protein